MSLNIYSKSRLFFGDEEIINFKSVQYSDTGNNDVIKLQIQLSDSDIENYSLYGKEVKFFLNYGSIDSVPFFRGFIREVNASKKSVSVSAYDPRTYLTGKESPSLNITEENNFDGYTLAQFLHEYILTNVNRNNTLIGLDFLNETDPPVSLTNYRSSNTSPLKVIKDNIPQNIDDIENIKINRLVIVDDGTKSNIMFRKEESISSEGRINFSLEDGIVDLNTKRRTKANTFRVKHKGMEKDGEIVYVHNNLPTGAVSVTLSGTYSDAASASEAAFLAAIKEEEIDREMTMSVSKGHYLEVGTIISLNSGQETLDGNHRIVGKNINVSDSNITCSFKLGRERPVLKDYLQTV